MTRREVFIHADPHTIHEAIGFYEVDFDGHMVQFRTEKPFNICKGLQMFAERMMEDIDDEKSIQQIIDSYGLVRWKAESIYYSIMAPLMSVPYILGLSDAPNPEKAVNEWLDQDISENDSDYNHIAASIISELINSNNG